MAARAKIVKVNWVWSQGLQVLFCDVRMWKYTTSLLEKAWCFEGVFYLF